MNTQTNEREKIGDMLDERLRFERLLSDISARFVNVSPEQVDGEIENALRMVLEFFQVDRCALLQILPDKTFWRITHATAAEDTPSVPVGMQLSVTETNPWSYDKLILKREVLNLSNLDDLPAEANVDKQTWIGWGIRSNLNIPIIVSGPVNHIFAINTIKRERVWPGEIIPRLRLLGEIFVNALMRRDAEQALHESGLALEERLRFESLLSDVSARVVQASAEQLDGEIENALRMVLEFFQVDRCGLIRASRDRTAWHATHVAHADDKVWRVPVGFDFPRTKNPWAYERLFDKGQVLAFSSIANLPPEAQVDRQTWLERGTRSSLLIPISTGEAVDYVITINALKRERDWPGSFIPRLRLLGEILVNSLERRKSRTELEEQLRFERVLTEISGRFVNLRADQVDSEIMDAERRICECLGLDVGGLWQWTNDMAGPLLLTHLYGSVEAPLPERMDAADYFPWYQQQMLAGCVVAFSAVEELPAEARRDAESYRYFGIRSNLTIPLAVGGKPPIGALGFNTTRAERNWPEALVKQLKLLAQVFINALARKRADEQIRNQMGEIERLKQRLEKENIVLREELVQERGFGKIIGSSEALNYVLFRVGQVAPTDATVLILGETGTGKGMVANAIHGLSRRRERPMITVNCAALPTNLIESELFGREKGAFTGAHARQAGRFEAADGGTIFLDEIGELPLELQAKLLRVLQDGEFERLGSAKTVKVNVRIIASTSRDLREEVRDGRFREDLYYRLNVFPVTIPPLRDRADDIPELVRFFADKYSRKIGKQIETIPKVNLKTLQAYHWPGNVRELEHVIERSVITTQGTVLQVADRLEPIRGGVTGDSSPKDLAAMEREHILRVLRDTGWRIEGPKGAAAILKLNPSTLRSRIKKLGIKRSP